VLTQVPLLSFLAFGITYPLFLWLSVQDPIKNNFHRFHLGCPTVIAGFSVIWLFFLPVEQGLKNMALLWLAAALAVNALFWNKEKVHLLTVTLLSLWGMKLFAIVYAALVRPDAMQTAIGIFAGSIVAGAFYAMNLGHFYLNVHGLRMDHLKKAVVALAVLLALRLAWNAYYLAVEKVMHAGEMRAAWTFINSLDGFLLWVAIFFGTVFPLGGSYFAFGTLKLKNTQATTGILYALLSAILLGDLAYKYYLLKFNIPL